MSQAVILLWLPAAAAGSSADLVGAVPTSESQPTANAPSPTERALLNRWAERRLLVVQAPRPDPPSRYAGYSDELVRRIEDLLEQARTLSGSLDEDRALEQLLAAEALIYDHPELPQAALLLAEAASQQADIAERGGRPELGNVQRLRALVLEGSRAATYTERSHAAIAGPKARPVRIQGLAAPDQLEWDGQRQPSTLILAGPGEHHVRVLRFGELVYAGFVMVPLGRETVHLAVPAPDPCTRGDLFGVSAPGRRLVGTENVHCSRWIAARPAGPSRIEVALCQKDHCGRLLPWQSGDGTTLSAPMQPEPGWRWPVWATYLTLGLGVAATTSAVLWQSGAFDEPGRGPVTFTFGGVQE